MNESYQTEEVSLLEIFQAVKKGIWMIICLTIIGSCLAASATIMWEEKVYETTSTMVIGKESAKIFYEDKYTQSDIAMYEKTANTYIEVAKSNTVLDTVAQQFPKYTSDQISKMVTPSARTGTLILEFKGIGKDRKDIMDITNAYSEAMIDECTRILPVGQLEMLDSAKLPENPIASKIVLNTIIGFMLGGVVSMLLILFKMFREGNKIQTAEQVDQLLEIPVVATIK